MGLCTDTGRDSAALRPWKQKVHQHSTLRQAWLICKARETGLSSLLGAKESLPLATKLPLHNKYVAGRRKRHKKQSRTTKRQCYKTGTINHSYENECHRKYMKQSNYWRILIEMCGKNHLPSNLSSKICSLSGPHSSCSKEATQTGKIR